MTDHPQDILFDLTIDAPIDRVWTDMTDTERTPLWLGCMRYEKKLGHVFYMQQDAEKRLADDVSGATHCEILKLKAPHEFSFSWYFPDTPKTTVTISLETIAAKKTRVSFLHTGWDQFTEKEILSIRDALANGWTSFVLPGLKKLCESV